jgi:hypothetical protein
LIQQAKTDPDISLGYDDAIQVGAVCGGRYGKKPRRYELTYYPQGETERGRWYLTLDHFEIEDIGDGRMTEISMYCCTAPDCRCKFREPDRTCFYCDYFDDPNYGTFEFPLAAEKLRVRGISGLDAKSTKETVTEVLGSPDKIGGGVVHESLGYIPPWFSYRRSDCQLNIAFTDDGTILRVTVNPQT